MEKAKEVKEVSMGDTVKAGEKDKKKTPTQKDLNDYKKSLSFEVSLYELEARLIEAKIRIFKGNKEYSKLVSEFESELKRKRESEEFKNKVMMNAENGDAKNLIN